MTAPLRLATALLSLVIACASGAGAKDDKVSFEGPIKIAELLWDASPQSAAQTLSGVLSKALDRKQLAAMPAAIQPLRSKLEAILQTGNREDPRWTPALASILLTADSPASYASLVSQTLSDSNRSARGLLAKVWFHADATSAFDYFFEALLKAESPQQASDLIGAAVLCDRQRTARILLADWLQLAPITQAAAIEPLTASAATMQTLIQAVKSGVVSKDLINTNQLRKWLQADGPHWRPLIEPIWGRIRETADDERQALVAKTLKLLQSGVSGSVTNGQTMFVKVCAQCHLLHGQGFEVGPDIAGNGRGNLQQLVSNVLDPSLVIGEAFLAKTVLTFDGTIVSGLVVAENDRYLKLKVQGGKIIELDKGEDIESIKISRKSLMPEGIEAQLTQQELLDLLAFLCLLKPLDAADNSLIPGTPEGFVSP